MMIKEMLSEFIKIKPVAYIILAYWFFLICSPVISLCVYFSMQGIGLAISIALSVASGIVVADFLLISDILPLYLPNWVIRNSGNSCIKNIAVFFDLFPVLFRVNKILLSWQFLVVFVIFYAVIYPLSSVLFIYVSLFVFFDFFSERIIECLVFYVFVYVPLFQNLFWRFSVYAMHFFSRSVG
jgi:hypothetical protein